MTDLYAGLDSDSPIPEKRQLVATMQYPADCIQTNSVFVNSIRPERGRLIIVKCDECERGSHGLSHLLSADIGSCTREPAQLDDEVT